MFFLRLMWSLFSGQPLGVLLFLGYNRYPWGFPEHFICFFPIESPFSSCFLKITIPWVPSSATTPLTPIHDLDPARWEKANRVDLLKPYFNPLLKTSFPFNTEGEGNTRWPLVPDSPLLRRWHVSQGWKILILVPVLVGHRGANPWHLQRVCTAVLWIQFL